LILWQAPNSAVEQEGAWPGAPLSFSEASEERRVPLFVPIGCGFIVFAGLTFIGAPYLGILGLPSDSGDGPAAPFAGSLGLEAGEWEGNRIPIRITGVADGTAATARVHVLLRAADGTELYSGSAGTQQTLGDTYTISYTDRDRNGIVSGGDWMDLTVSPSNARAHAGVFRVLSAGVFPDVVRLP